MSHIMEFVKNIIIYPNSGIYSIFKMGIFYLIVYYFKCIHVTCY